MASGDAQSWIVGRQPPAAIRMANPGAYEERDGTRRFLYHAGDNSCLWLFRLLAESRGTGEKGISEIRNVVRGSSQYVPASHLQS